MELQYTTVHFRLLSKTVLDSNVPYLHEDVDQVEHLTEDKLVDIRVVGAEGAEEVVDVGCAAVAELLRGVVQRVEVHALDQHVKLAACEEKLVNERSGKMLVTILHQFSSQLDAPSSENGENQKCYSLLYIYIEHK